ncbi:MAG: DMT family transporter, partial [Nanoarchaeota archaeon]|nr:DMT family transporter [Nanoarchaeota archaeon]
MIGILLGLGSAIFNATWNTLIGALNKKSSQLQVAMYNCLFAFLFILPFLIGQGLNVKSNIFWLVLVVFVIIDSIAMLLYIKAIHISGVSKTVPLLSFTPVLVILIGFVFLKEIPTLIAVLGVLLVILGAYFLNIKQYNLGFFEPILEIFKDKGTKYMFIVAVLFAIDAMLFKLGQIYSDQLTIVSMYLLFEGLIFFAVINYNKKQKKKSIKLDFKTLVTLLLLLLLV